jgi:hypothetical protein
MSAPEEHAFANAFYEEFSQNGETGIPNVFVKTEAEGGTFISEEEFIDAGHVLQDHQIGVNMQALDYSKEGTKALFKTAVEIPGEVLELLRLKNHLGRVALTQAH